MTEVLDQLEAEGHFDNADIYISPPSDVEQSEEDSADEDAGGTINNLSGRQLRSAATATCKFKGKRSTIGDDSDDNESVDGCEPAKETAASGKRVEQSSAPEPSTTSRKKSKTQRHWVNKDLESDWPDFTLQAKKYTGCSDPVALFECFFDDEVCNFLAEMSNKYASEVKSDHNFEVAAPDIRAFIAILLLSGYVNVPRWRLLWEVDSETFNYMVSNAMRRNQFENLKRYFHCADNAMLDQSDKFGKMRPLMSMLNERYLNHASLEEHLCVDESMAPYYGRHGAKQFIRCKPVRFGYKFWSLCDRLGYLVQFEPYQSHQYDKSLGLGASVVIDLMAELPDHIPFKIYGDRFFSSLNLVEALRSHGYGYSGTIMANRMEHCPVEIPKLLSKQRRGTVDFKLDDKSNTIVVAWNDNRPVYMVSSVHGVNPIGTCMRWMSQEKKKVPVNVPEVVSKYNMYMGGVDRMDQNIGNYRVGIRSKKWWWAVLVFCIETSVHNAWQLYRKTEDGMQRPLDFLEFRRSVVKTYLFKYATNPKSSGRPKNNKAMEDRVPLPVRFDHTDHFLAPAVKQNRCGVCRKNTTKMCQKCRVNLHETCFRLFHVSD